MRSTHSNGEHENPTTRDHDLQGKNVLIGRKYSYFGIDGPELPPDLEMLKVGRAHKCRFTRDVIESFIAFISQFNQGVTGRPTKWPVHDHSWRQSDS